MIKLGIGLLALMCANILFGSSLAKIKKSFSKEKFFSGIFKVLCIVGGTSLMYLCAYLNPNIMAIDINGTMVNIESAMEALFIAGIIYYATQDINKLYKLLKIKGVE